jgi:hypothetical protein
VQNMKIHFERSGGFAGISTATTVDYSSLPFDEQDRLRNLIDNAKFFDLPSETPLPKKGADYFKYKIMIEMEENNKKSHTVKTNDMTMPSELRPLVDYLQNKTKSRR